MRIFDQIKQFKPGTAEIKSQKKDNWFTKEKYWIFQIVGWSTFSILNLIIIIAFGEYTWQKLVLIIAMFITGFALTHQFRSYIKRKNWMALPIKKLIPRVILVSFIFGMLMYFVVFGVNYSLGQFKSNEFKPASPFVGTINLGGIIAIWSLIYFSVHYFQNYKLAEIESYIWEAAVKDFELKTLKSQLNPHFIFNALNSIRALIEIDPSSAQTAVTKLSNILRYSLKMERSETVSLEEEMQIVKDYLTLEEMRLEERIKYNISIDPLSANIEVPPMMIQTLVENGIKHGIAKRTGGGELSIETLANGSNLFITIVNSGQIQESLLKQSNGFGISNTKQRLNLIYGSKANFLIKNNSDDTVSAKITIPIGEKKNESINS